tara:strand:- start:426 stop:530 length:105 start_codon:yes stop_codon:yes gene_type:complete
MIIDQNKEQKSGNGFYIFVDKLEEGMANILYDGI